MKNFAGRFLKKNLPWGSVPSGRENRRILHLSRSEIGTTNAPQCQVPGDHTIGSEPQKMATNIARRRRGTWEGVPVATWCSE